MEKGLVSIVLPIYNVEKYLKRCVDSIRNQTYSHLEILLIDDGSTDGCPHLCDEFAEMDCRIRVLHKQNAGLGMARNSGIEIASGEYICFFDSDDYIENETIEKLYCSAIDNDADVVLFGYKRVDSNNTIIKEVCPKSEKAFYYGKEIEEIVLPNILAPDPKTGRSMDLMMSAWSCMYSMRLIQDSKWKFVSERDFISEDLVSILSLYRFVKKVVILHDAFYNYCENEQSLTKIFREDRYIKNKKCYDKCYKLCIEYKYSDDIRERLKHQYMNNIIGLLKILTISKIGVIKRYRYVRDILYDNHLINIINSMDVSHEKKTRRILFNMIKMKLVVLVLFVTKLKA